jgi:hypothetical protein
MYNEIKIDKTPSTLKTSKKARLLIHPKNGCHGDAHFSEYCWSFTVFKTHMIPKMKNIHVTINPIKIFIVYHRSPVL